MKKTNKITYFGYNIYKQKFGKYQMESDDNHIIDSQWLSYISLFTLGLQFHLSYVPVNIGDLNVI